MIGTAEPELAFASSHKHTSSEVLRIVCAGDSDARKWNAFVEARADGTIFHGWSWRRAVEESFGHRPFYLMAVRGERIVGVLPLFGVRSLLAGRLLVSVPYAVYGGALVEDESASEALLAALRGLAEREGVRQADLRSVQAVWPELGTIADRYVAFHKPLPATEEEVLAGLPRKARAAARNARTKFGLEVQFGDENLRAVWYLYTRSMRRLGSPNYPLRFFEELVRRTPGRHLVSLILHGERPTAGLVSFIHRDTLMPYFAGCDERLERTGANNFLYLTAMEWGVRNGLARFDFGRSRRNNRGSYDFKCHQGFEPIPLEYQVWTPPGQVATELTPDSAKLQLAIRAWRRLPLWMTRQLSTYVVRSIPG